MSPFREPSGEEVREAIRRITTPQLRRVFFERLKNPHWLEPLAKERLFENPPEPEVTADGLIRDHYWPEIDYLIRIAPTKPSAVVDILLKLESTKNAWVRRAVFTIGASIPAAEAARLKPLLRSWLATGFGWRTDPREMVDFAVNLLAGEQQKTGRWMANVLFRPQAPGDEGSARPALDEYWYTDGLPRTVAAMGPDGLWIVLPWLAEYERLHGNRTGSLDMTHVARESVRRKSPDGIGGHRSVEQALIDAVRDLAVGAARHDPARVVAVLLSSDMNLGRKIALFAIAEALRSEELAPAETEGLLAAASRLLWESASREDACRIEFGELARAVASRSPELLSPLAEFLAAGPAIGLETLRDRLNRDPDGHPEELDRRVAAYVDGWKHRWLAAVGHDALPADLRPVLAELDARLGRIEDPLKPAHRITSWVGPTSPLSLDEMASKSAAELVTHLESWHDNGDGWGPEPSHEGQGRQLTALVTTNPMVVSGAGELVGRLRPTYLSAVLEGWDAALKAGFALDWTQVAGVVRGVLRHSDDSEFPAEGGKWDDEPDYRSAKHASVRLLESLVGRRDESVVPPGVLADFAELLLTDASDEVAWVQYVEGVREGGMDALTLSINWQWPIRLRGLLNLVTHGTDTAWYARAKTALESELARIDEPGASAAVIGEGLSRLLNTDPSWVEAKASEIFGGSEGLTRNQQVALTTAMAVHYYHHRLYALLSPAMIAAISLGDAVVAGWDHNSDPLQKIGEWVVSALIRGDTTLDDSVARAFFSSASAEVRGKAIGHVAWSFFHAEAVDADIRDRFADLWNCRFDHVRSHPEDAHELNEFHWVVKCGKFSVSWWLPLLKEALELDPDLARERYMIGKEVAAAAESDPAGALAALKGLMVLRGEAGLPAWDLSRNAVPLVIARAIADGAVAVKDDAIAFMNWLGEQGYIGLEQEVNDVLSGKIGQDDVSEP